MTFKEFLEAQQYPVAQGVKPPQYPVAQGVKPPVNPALPDTWPENELFRITNGDFNQPERAILRKQKEEMRQYGVILTPFRLNGGKTLTDNPVWQSMNPNK